MSSKYPYYDIDGNLTPLDISDPADQKEFEKLWDKEYRRVGWAEPVPGVTISTVFLPIDHSFGDGPPILFETMVFGLDDGIEYQWRYATKEQAVAAHELVVAAVAAGSLDENFDPYEEEG